MSTHKYSIMPGVILIVIGVLLLVHQIAPYSFSWYDTYPFILMGLGLLFFFSIIGKRNKGGVFPGTFLFLLGLFYFLRNFDIIEYYYLREIWPIILIILGLSFVAVFITKPDDWGPLIPGGLFLFLGVVFLLNKLHLVYWDLGDVIADYWPAILILIGGRIIFRSLKRHPYGTETGD